MEEREYQVAQYFDCYFEHYVSDKFDIEEEAKKHLYANFTNHGKTTYRVVGSKKTKE